MVDIYDAATSQRCYSEAKPPVRVLDEMRRFCKGFFDPIVESAFYRIIPPFPIGQVVTLSNGIEAVVVDFNPNYPVRPKVQCLRAPDGQRFHDPSLEEIDLALFTELHVAAVDGVDVRPYLASQEVALPDLALIEGGGFHPRGLRRPIVVGWVERSSPTRCRDNPWWG